MVKLVVTSASIIYVAKFSAPSFVCRACIEGKRWVKEAGEWKKKAMELAKRD